MRSLALLSTLLLTLAACTPEDATPKTAGTASVSGAVVERIDGPPYSFLKLDTGDGLIWVAVPLTSAEAGGRVTVINGATVKGFEARSIGRRFDSILFGVLQRK